MLKTLSKTEKIGTVLLALVSIGLILGSFGMIFANPNSKDAAMFAPLHLGSYIHILGIIKLLIGVGLFFKRTHYVAALVGTGYLGGAIMATITIGQPPIVAGIFILVLWAGMELLSHGNFLKLCRCGKTCFMCKDEKICSTCNR